MTLSTMAEVEGAKVPSCRESATLCFSRLRYSCSICEYLVHWNAWAAAHSVSVNNFLIRYCA